MAKNAQFYLLNPEKKITVEQLACDLAAQAWRLGKRVLIACETEEQAFLIDEGGIDCLCDSSAETRNADLKSARFQS